MARLLLAVTIALAVGDTYAITVAEAPGTAYALCSVTDLTSFGAKVFTETTDCSTKASYDFNSIYMPTDTERRQLCACTSLIAKLTTAQVPHCAIYRGGAMYSYKEAAEYAFALCGASGAATTTTTTTTPLPTVATSSPGLSTSTTTTPSTTTLTPTQTPAVTVATASDSSRHTRSGLFSGIGTLVVVVIIIIIVRTRRRQRLARPGKTNDQPVQVEVVPVAQVVREELSPVETGYDKYPVITPTHPSQRPIPSAPAAEDVV